MPSVEGERDEGRTGRGDTWSDQGAEEADDDK
jgi:hypothetical protein